MPPKNIERFDRIAVAIFMRLYEEFPNRIDINPNDVGFEAFPEEEDGEVLFDRMAMAGSTMSWLKDEGFISVQSVDLQGKYGGVRLSQKGLTLLGTPNSLDEHAETLADTMMDALSDTAKQTASDVMKSFLTKAAIYTSGLIS